jgi:hypothetical protein
MQKNLATQEEQKRLIDLLDGELFALKPQEVDGEDVVLGVFSLGGNQGVLALEIESAAESAAALSAFALDVRVHPDGQFHTYLAGDDWAGTDNSNLRWTSEEGPQDLAAGHVAAVIVRVGAVDAVRLRAGVAADAATITVRGSATQE